MEKIINISTTVQEIQDYHNDLPESYLKSFIVTLTYHVEDVYISEVNSMESSPASS